MHILIHKMIHKTFITKRKNGTYYYRRRVPSHIQDALGKDMIFLSLKTKDPEIAKTKARRINTEIEAQWDDVNLNGGQSDAKYQRAIKIAKMHNLAYMPAEELAQRPVDEILKRIDMIEGKDPKANKAMIEAVLGGVPKPKIMLSGCFERYSSRFNGS